MKPLPHRYRVTAAAGRHTDVELTSPGLAPLWSAAPAEYDGPGDRWSPETLLVGAVADCFVLTFRALAKASRLDWTDITCEGSGKVDQIEDATRFAEIGLHVELNIRSAVDTDRAHLLLQKCKRYCLVGNSLRLEVKVSSDIRVENPAAAIPA
jgi:organic hydroperoxide reductase OsmC/OhrA